MIFVIEPGFHASTLMPVYTADRMVSGIQTSGESPTLIPANAGGSTATTSNTIWRMRSFRPMTAGSPCSRCRQNAWLITATGCASIPVSTSAPKVRPTSGSTPSNGK